MSEEIIEKIRFKLAIDRNEKLFIDKKILQELYEGYLEEKEKNKELEKKLANRVELLDYMLSENYISKNKIREKIKELRKEIDEKQGLDFALFTNGIIIVLKELLEENKSNENNI
jgi:hypothetical protein